MSDIDHNKALKMLLEGNKRYAEGELTHPNQTPERRKELLSGQDPFAVVIACSDSRVPVESIFDVGIGDIFVIRTAGNILDAVGIGSVQYAVEHLGVQLVFVLGHTSCGAVGATLSGGDTEGYLRSVVEFLKPAAARGREMPGDAYMNSIKANVELMKERLKNGGESFRKALEGRKLRVAGAVYNMESGLVEMLE